MLSAVRERPAAERGEGRGLGGVAISAAIHAGVLVAVLGVFGRRPIERYAVPGTEQGMELLTYYSPGNAAHAPNQALSKKTKAKAATVVPHPALEAPRPDVTQTASGETGAADSLLSGKGEGDISMALEKYFPYPRPDLSALPHGTRGDVILDAVVGEDGKIEELTLVQGLGPAIDNVVIATVKQWSYTPAMKNGVPVPSKQELHFHYEKS